MRMRWDLMNQEDVLDRCEPQLPTLCGDDAKQHGKQHGKINAKKLPSYPAVCTHKRPCIYRIDCVCNDASINKKNSDAACHRTSNRAILSLLERVPNDEGD